VVRRTHRAFRLVLVAGVLAGCGRIGFDPAGDVVSSGRCGVVVPTYPLHPGWGDYVAFLDPTQDRDHQPDTPCDGTEVGGPLACIHGGERRQVRLDGVASCTGLAATDALGAFQWTCRDDSGVAVVSTTGLAAGHGLASLVTAAGWRSDRVDVTSADGALCSSTEEIWWDTPVRALPDNPGTGVVALDATGVYVLDTSRETSGYALATDRVSVAILDGAVLSYDATAGVDCNASTGLTAAPDGHCVLTAGATRFLWIEGRIAGDPGAANMRGILVRGTAFTRLHRVDVRSTVTAGIDISDALATTLSDVDEQGSQGNGISLDRFVFGQLRRVRAANNAADGIHARGDFGVDSLQTTAFTTFADIVVADNGGEGLGLVCGAHRNITAGVLAVSNGDCGLYSVCNNGSVFTHVTAIDNAIHGVRIDSGSNHRVSQVVAASNGGDGFHLEQSTNDLGITSLMSTDNGQFGAVVDVGNTMNRFDGFLVVGNNTGGDCRVQGATSPGLVDVTCTTTGADGSSGYGAELSTAVLRNGRTAAGAFAAKVTTDDPASPFDNSGTAASVNDWWALTGRSRAWGRDGSAFPDPTTRGLCTSACRIWDWQSVAGGAVADRSGDGATVNEPFVPGAACPSAVAGDVVASAALGRETLGDGVGDDDGYCESGEACDSPEQYLINAVEVLGDDDGNDDGLCESGERCVYTPDLGAGAQGTELTSPCVFVDGAVTGVRMFTYR